MSERLLSIEERAAIAETLAAHADPTRPAMHLLKALADLDTADAERDAAIAQRNDLLARIHRDGGQHTGAVGVEASVSHAHVIVAEAFAERDAAIARAEAAEIAADRLAQRLVALELREPPLLAALRRAREALAACQHEEGYVHGTAASASSTRGGRMTTPDAVTRMRSAPACAECNGDETMRSPTAPMRHALEYAADCPACAAIALAAARVGVGLVADVGKRKLIVNVVGERIESCCFDGESDTVIKRRVEHGPEPYALDDEVRWLTALVPRPVCTCPAFGCHVHNFQPTPTALPDAALRACEEGLAHLLALIGEPDYGTACERVAAMRAGALPTEPSAEAINAARAASTILVLQGEPLPLSRVTVRAVLVAAYAAERGRK